MLDDYSELEFQHQKEFVKEEILFHIAPSENPQAYLIVGQPGAGKSAMADLFMRKHENNILFLSGDDYRKYHPRYRALQAEYGDDAVLHTQRFAGQMTEALIEDCSMQHYHLIIEGTLRTTEVPLKTKALLEARGYAVSLNVLLVRPEISYLSTIKRYHLMQEMGGIPRMTPKEHHDAIVSNIVGNLSLLYHSNAFTEILVYNRAGQCLYDSNDAASSPADLFRKEFSRKLTPDEIQSIHQQYNPYVSDAQIDVLLGEYQRKLRHQFSSGR